MTETKAIVETKYEIDSTKRRQLLTKHLICAS
jgi:hypothetical protein